MHDCAGNLSLTTTETGSIIQSTKFKGGELNLVTNDGNVEVTATSGDVASVMRFSLNANFHGDAAVLTRPRLDLLGASGLATRVRFLESERLLP